MKIGFSTLALFMKSYGEWLDTAYKDGFNLIEILCEGPYWPRNNLGLGFNEFEIFQSYDVDVFLHAPTIDLNPASLNPGIRRETLLQLKETTDFAIKIGAEAITTHPGLIHRLEDRVREMGMSFAIETLKEAADYAHDHDIIFSVENMPQKYAFFCNSAQEHEFFVNECDCHATVDLGHANTTKDPKLFLKLDSIYYYHLSDNNGDKDQHLVLGEGNLDLNLLHGIDKVIIELNNYFNVLKSRNKFFSLLKG